MSKILITGATGFLGSHLVERIRKEGHTIRILALPGDAKAKKYEMDGIEVVWGDIRDKQTVEKAVIGTQKVFHLAAIVTDWAPRQLYYEVNVTGTKNICQAALKCGVERFILVSTNDVFGLNEDRVMDETFPYSPWGEPYADTKLQATQIAWDYYRKGLPVTMAYPCWVYGPDDPIFIPSIADALKKKELLFWRKDVLVWPAYIENVIDLLVVLSEHPNAIGQGFLVHDGVFDTFQNLAGKIADHMGIPRAKRQIPYWSAYVAAIILELIWKIMRIKSRPLLTTYTVKNLGSRLRFSINKAEQLLNWRPPISYDEGLKMTLFQEYRK